MPFKRLGMGERYRNERRGAALPGDRREVRFMEDRPPKLPLEALHAAADDEAARSHIEALRAELAKDRPSAESIATHVERLRERPALLALVSNWFDDPRVQTFLADLSSAGL